MQNHRLQDNERVHSRKLSSYERTVPALYVAGNSQVETPYTVVQDGGLTDEVLSLEGMGDPEDILTGDYNSSAQQEIDKRSPYDADTLIDSVSIKALLGDFDIVSNIQIRDDGTFYPIDFEKSGTKPVENIEEYSTWESVFQNKDRASKFKPGMPTTEDFESRIYELAQDIDLGEFEKAVNSDRRLSMDIENSREALRGEKDLASLNPAETIARNVLYSRENFG